MRGPKPSVAVNEILNSSIAAVNFAGDVKLREEVARISEVPRRGGGEGCSLGQNLRSDRAGDRAEAEPARAVVPVLNQILCHEIRVVCDGGRNREGAPGGGLEQCESSRAIRIEIGFVERVNIHRATGTAADGKHIDRHNDPIPVETEARKVRPIDVGRVRFHFVEKPGTGRIARGGNAHQHRGIGRTTIGNRS